MKLEFKSGRRMPISHVFKWVLSQIGIVLFVFGPFVFLGYQFFSN